MTVIIKLFSAQKKEIAVVRKIEAIVRSERLDALRKAFLEAGINKMTVTEVREYGNAAAHTEIYRSDAFSVDSLAKVKVETIVPQNMVPIVIALLKTKGQTGNSEEEKILISSVNDVGRASP
ncbi:MAG: P-II family nitrogen regulator [Ignavibacteriae bacterium]|nr:MAG: P-II family nitrogen regulator [Ignavibacteriota bacterium]